MDERLIKLAHAIEETKELWEEFKTEEIRIYLEYLKELWSSLVEQWSCSSLFSCVVSVECARKPPNFSHLKHEQTDENPTGVF